MLVLELSAKLKIADAAAEECLSQTEAKVGFLNQVQLEGSLVKTTVEGKLPGAWWSDWN